MGSCVRVGAVELEMHEFVEGLLRVAVEWAKGLEKEIVFCFHSIVASIAQDAKKDEVKRDCDAHARDRLTIGRCLSLRNTVQCDEFRMACRSQAVQDVLTQHSDALSYAYMVYSGMDTEAEVR